MKKDKKKERERKKKKKLIKMSYTKCCEEQNHFDY